MDGDTGKPTLEWIRRLECALGELDASDPDMRLRALIFVRNMKEYALTRGWTHLHKRLEKILIMRSYKYGN